MKSSESELMPLVGAMEKSVPRIYRIPTKARDPAGVEDGQQIEQPTDSSELREAALSKVGNLEDSLPRFGPFYSVDQPSVDATKKKAWEHVLKKSSLEGQQGVITEIYLKAVRRVEKEAKDMYADKKASSLGIGSSFRWMMIRDGCFFLQLALLILGCSEQLGYPQNDPFFGKKPKKKDIKKWIEAMFYVGNQIPLLILRELMKQNFFQDVITRKKWNPAPSGLCKVVLYKILVLPALKRESRSNDPDHQYCDLLHALQNLVMGPAPAPLDHQYDMDDEIDLEANAEGIGHYPRIFPSTIGGEEATNSPDDSIISDRVRNFLMAMGAADSLERIFPCATELQRAGIRIKKLKSGGLRSIYFKSYYLWAFIYLPVLPVDDNVELIFRNLIAYENLKQPGKGRGEVSSYLRLMSDLIQTTRDAGLLRKKGIIEGNLDHVEKLPEILSRLTSQNTSLTQDLCILRSRIRDYSSPWIHYKSVINVVVLLTLIQSLFAVLAYFKPPKP